MLSALQGVSDRVEGDEAGHCLCAHRRSREAVLWRGGGSSPPYSNAAPAYLNPRAGVADAKFPAFAAWTCSGTWSVQGTRGGGGLPCTPLDRPAPHSQRGLKRELHRFGLHTMGAIASMSRYMLTDRFGPDGQRAWLLCSGIDDSHVVPLAFQESVVEHTSLPFHSSSMDALFVAVDALLKRAYSRPDVRGGMRVRQTSSARRPAGRRGRRASGSNSPWVVGERAPSPYGASWRSSHPRQPPLRT